MSTSIYVLERRQSSTCRTLVISCPWGHQVINWRLSSIAMFAHKADILVRRALITRQGKRNILLYYFLRDIFFIPKSKINILPANKIKSLKIFFFQKISQTVIQKKYVQNRNQRRAWENIWVDTLRYSFCLKIRGHERPRTLQRSMKLV